MVRAQELIFRLSTKMARRKYPESLPIRFHSKRVYILPTRFGYFFGFFTLLMAMAGLNYNNNMALLLTFLIAGMALLTPLYTVRNLVDLSLVEVVARPVFAGDDVRFAVTLANESSQARAVIWAESHGPADVTDIPANGKATLLVSQPTQKRGWQSMQRIRFFTRFPVGLFYAWSWSIPDARCLVYPAPEENGQPLPTGAGVGTGKPERSGDEEWSGLRDYSPGDPSRTIAWKVVARTDQMVTKTFARHESFRIELDFSTLAELDLERRLSRLARWVLDASAEGLMFTLILPTGRIGPGQGEEHKHRCLRALAEYHA